MNERIHQEQVAVKRAAVTLLLLLCTASIQAQAPAPKPGPEYKAYEVWLGDWTYEGEAKDSPIGPGGKFSGRTTVRWILDGFFMEFRSQEKGNLGDLESIEFDWYDAVVNNYLY